MSLQILEEYTIDLLKNGNPEDFVSQQEADMLAELKKDPICNGIDDKTLFVFLFTRKLDLKRTLELLRANRAWREKNGYPINSGPTRSELNQGLLATNYIYYVPGKHDFKGRIVVYLFPARVDMHDFTAKDFKDYAVWSFHEAVANETLSRHRVGMVYVEDIAGFSIKKMDFGIAKEVNNSFMNTFPMRIAQILIVNPGRMLQFLMKIGRAFLKKKLVDRIQLVELDEVKKFVDPSQLIRYYGGEIDDPIIADVEEKKRLEEEKKAAIIQAKEDKKAAAKQETEKKEAGKRQQKDKEEQDKRAKEQLHAHRRTKDSSKPASETPSPVDEVERERSRKLALAQASEAYEQTTVPSPDT